jgi:xanthine dehydrogenase YagS FAD-binding subunit
MPSMRTFEYDTPATAQEAIALLRQDGAADRADGTAVRLRPLRGVQPLAGGTDLLTLMKADVAAPVRLVNVKRVAELTRGVEETSEGLVIGALTTVADLESNAAVRERYPALAEAVSLAASPQLRNMATIGGNLLQRPRCWYFRNTLFHCWLKGGDECHARDGENEQHALFGYDGDDGDSTGASAPGAERAGQGRGSPCVAVHPSDPANALLALDAEVRLRGQDGERTLPLAEFFALPTGDRRTETVIRPDELLLSVRIPAPAEGTRSTYLKAMDRKIWAFALVGVAAVLRVDAGRIADARIVLGGVAPIPWRAVEAERVLAGQPPGDDLFTRAAGAALSDARPLAHNAYKLPLARNLLRRALAALAA